MYINGQLTDSDCGNTFDVVCPGNETVISTISWACKEDTYNALEAAEEGFEFWSQLPIQERISWIEKLRNALIKNEDLLRTSVMYEMGKVWEGTEEDFTSITNSLKFYADEIQNRVDIPIEDKEGTHRHTIISQPLGVVVAFLAYNFPLLNLGFKLGPALAAGCSIIIKPSEYSPLSAYIIGEICESIDFPKGVINVICGDVSDVGIPLCESKIPKLITMIGSTETAQKLIMQSSSTSIKRFSMECGGNAPFIVFDDSDLDLAIKIGTALKIGNSGQICVAANRYFIHEDILDEFISGITENFGNVNIGFGKENNPDLGPLANEGSIIKLESIVKKAVEQGAKLIYGGKAIDRPGYYFEPTVLLIEDPYCDILQEEIFGPIAMIVPFTGQEEVLELANNTYAGLASYVFSNDDQKLKYFSEKLEFGEVQLNGIKYDIYLPHGGIKNSGIGVDCSIYALDDYLIKKRISKAILTT